MLIASNELVQKKLTIATAVLEDYITSVILHYLQGSLDSILQRLCKFFYLIDCADTMRLKSEDLLSVEEQLFKGLN